MKYETIIAFAKAHKNSHLQNKDINYGKLVKKIFQMNCDPIFKELDIYKVFCGFFNEKYKEPIQQAIQFQGGIDYLLSKTSGEIL